VSWPKGSVQILKLAAAQRQLDAAIRMTFSAEDELAITTVAAAAYGILKGLKEKRGRKVLADEWRDNLLGVARSFVRGTLPESEIASLKESGVWPAVETIAEQIRAEGPNKTISELRSIFEVRIPNQTERQHWTAFNRVQNFLKHADRDHDAPLAAAEIKPVHLILAACSIYFDLMGHLTPEMEVWSLQELHVNRGLALSRPDRLREKMISALRAADETLRGELAMELIAILKTRARERKNGGKNES